MGSVSILDTSIVAKSITDKFKYPERLGTLGICKYGDEYLILRIAEDWKYCPGDWDFVMGTFQDDKKTPEQNAVINIEIHAGLQSIKIINRFPLFKWNDDESRVLFVLHPFLVKANDRKLKLSRKFSEGKWVKWESILENDRNDYLNNVLSHIEINLILARGQHAML